VHEISGLLTSTTIICLLGFRVRKKMMVGTMFERGKAVLDKLEIKLTNDNNSSESRVSTMSQRNNKNPRGQAMIGPSIVINGKISGDENLIIEGTVEGSIDLPNQDVVIGQAGRIKADLQGKVVHIEGKIEGDIKGVEQVIIANSGNVRGNLVAPRVTLEDGAVFKGSIDMDPGEPLLEKTELVIEDKMKKLSNKKEDAQ
jgi:cytoskeletal protein CcmA (bactofilin family)